MGTKRAPLPRLARGYAASLRALRRAPDDALTVAFFGDSYTAGSGVKPGRYGPRLGYAPQTAARLKVQATYFAQSSTGYVADGHQKNAAFSALPDRVQDVVDSRPDVAIVAAGVNDALHPAQEARAAADKVLRPLTDAGIRTIVIGPWDVLVRGADRPSLIAVRDVLREAAVFYSVPFLDPIEGRWVPDDGTGPDPRHPNIWGHSRIAIRLAAELRPLLDAR